MAKSRSRKFLIPYTNMSEGNARVQILAETILYFYFLAMSLAGFLNISLLNLNLVCSAGTPYCDHFPGDIGRMTEFAAQGENIPVTPFSFLLHYITYYALH